MVFYANHFHNKGTSSKINTNDKDDTVFGSHKLVTSIRCKQEMQEFTEVTNSRMMWLNFPSLFICLSVTGVRLKLLATQI
ncbi:hypothetical protein Hdeb2414_s0001g00038491 [Helianthus debilis subsp. tardiflorus]